MPLRAWRNLSLLIFSTALLLGMVQSASACQCVQRPTVLDAFDRADDAVIAKATSAGYADGTRSLTMVVGKVFKGNLKVKEQIAFGYGGGSDCIWTFRGDVIGVRFLFYLNRPESQFYPVMAPGTGLWYAFVCGQPEMKTPRQVAIVLEANKHAGVDIEFVRADAPQ